MNGSGEGAPHILGTINGCYIVSFNGYCCDFERPPCDHDKGTCHPDPVSAFS